MESFFWSLGMVPDAQFSNCRKQLTKVVQLNTVLDDLYDVYGPLDELELLTDAVQRVNDMAYDSLKEQRKNILPYLTKFWVVLFKSFLQEAKWTCNNVTPSFEEYLENAWVSSSGGVLLTQLLFAQSRH